MRTFVKKIHSEKVSVADDVAPSGERAASAGVSILEAVQFSVKAIGTNIEAVQTARIAHADMPVDISNQIENDAGADMSPIAEMRGRNTEFSQKPDVKVFPFLKKLRSPQE